MGFKKGPPSGGWASLFVNFWLLTSGSSEGRLFISTLSQLLEESLSEPLPVIFRVKCFQLIVQLQLFVAGIHICSVIQFR